MGTTEIRQDLIKTMIDGKNVQYVNEVSKYLVMGNTEIRQDLIKTMIDGKNVQYVNKVNT